MTATRTCVVCRKPLDQDDALRIVLGPDGAPAVDFKHKLPGRGAWVCWEKSCVTQVGQRGRLDRAFKCKVPVQAGDDEGRAWPASVVNAYLRRRQRELISVGGRAGQIRCGGSTVLSLLRKGWPVGLVLACDTGPTSASDWERKAKGYELSVRRTLLTSEEVGAALGRGGSRSVLAVGPGSAAQALGLELKRGSALL